MIKEGTVAREKLGLLATVLRKLKMKLLAKFQKKDPNIYPFF